MNSRRGSGRPQYCPPGSNYRIGNGGGYRNGSSNDGVYGTGFGGHPPPGPGRPGNPNGNGPGVFPIGVSYQYGSPAVFVNPGMPNPFMQQGQHQGQRMQQFGQGGFGGQAPPGFYNGPSPQNLGINPFLDMRGSQNPWQMQMQEQAVLNGLAQMSTPSGSGVSLGSASGQGNGSMASNEQNQNSPYSGLIGSGESGVGVEEGGVLIYIDNSNVWINTMEMSARNLKFRSDIRQDQRTRVNINRLLSLASNGRPIIRAVLYGSEPPPVAKFWNNVKECKFCRVDVQVTRRSTYSNKEREVDQNIMLDIGEDIVIHQNHARHGGTVIIFTGDGGMISAVRRALKYNWNVEVWAYRNSLAKDYQEETKDEKFVIKYLDDCFQDVVYSTLEWKSPIPRERSFVITLYKLPEDKKQEILETCVKTITELVRMPMAGRFLKDSDGVNSCYAHLAIVCSVGKLILKEDARSDAHNKASETDNNNHSSWISKKSSFHFSNDQWEMLPTTLEMDCIREHSEFYTKIKAGVESLVQESIRSNTNFFDNPKYDFNTDVYHKVEEMLSADRQKTFQQHEIAEELRINFDLMIRRYQPQLRSLVQFLQDMKQDFPDIECQESPANDDDGEGGFTVQIGRKGRKQKFQKYSQECKYAFRCINGFKCSYDHTKSEKEFFKLQSDPKLRLTYKSKPCDHYQAGKCKFKKSLSYCCPFAHGYYCSVCKCDEDGGHILANCPQPTLAIGVPSAGDQPFRYQNGAV